MTAALYKAPLKFEEIYVFAGCLRRTARKHISAQKKTSPVTKMPSWPRHDPSSGHMGDLKVTCIG